MTLNPQSTDSDTDSQSDIIGLEGGIVTIAKTHNGDDGVGHHVEVNPDTIDSAITAEVKADQIGDVAIPTEGDRVIIGYRITGRPIILGSRYSISDTVPNYEPGERVIGHPLSDAHIRLTSDGTVRMTDDHGNTIETKSDGSVVINDGSNKVVTDIETTTSDGYVTSVSTITSDDIFVP